jgi:UDP-glucuronate 4-epimerase
MSQHILVTGGAGFIGSHLTERLLELGYRVTVIDNFDPFYSRASKESNIHAVMTHPSFRLVELDIRDGKRMEEELTENYSALIHLAAKAGVRPSIADPLGYEDVNVKGTMQLLEFARIKGIKQFIFGSSSSVYGVNPMLPWKEDEVQLLPISPYAATKIAAELIGHVYSRIYGIRFLALRFFTVFGPRQRPDLAIHSFSKKILSNQPIQVFGDGTTRRDYTYVADIVAGIVAALHYNQSDFEIINLGNHQSVSLNELLTTLEEVLGKKLQLEHLPEQTGDVPATYADINKAQRLLNYHPHTGLKAGITAFRDWLLEK